MKLIRTNIGLIVFFIALAIAGITYFISNKDYHNKLVESTKQQIRFYVDLKTKLIDGKLNFIQQELKLLSSNTQNDIFLKNIADLKKHSANKVAVYNSRDLREEQQLHDWAREMMEHHGFYDLILVNKNGEIFFSTKKENAFGHNLTLVSDSTKHLSEAYNKIIHSENDFTISDFYTSDVINGAVGSFFCGVPKTDSSGNIIGVIILQVPITFISSELDNSLLMDSLESYIVSSDYAINDLGEKIDITKLKLQKDNSTSISITGDKKIKKLWQLTSVLSGDIATPAGDERISFLNASISFFIVCIVGILIIVMNTYYKISKGVTNSDILLVQTSWNLVSEYSTEIIRLFYKYLFESAPEVKPMFRSDQATQEQRMALMINTIVNSVDSLDEFRGSISQLAKSHTHMGVKREYFPLVVNALVNSIEEQYGRGFTSAHRRAWLKILTHISNIMIEEMEFYQSQIKKH